MFSFKDLNMKGVKVASSSVGLAPGRYIAKVKEAKVEKTRSGGHQVVVTLAEENGAGSIRDFINVHTPSSQEAERIGRERLMSLYFYGGHPDPENGPAKGVEGLLNLRVGINVVDNEYEKTNPDGTKEKRKGSALRRSGGYFDPGEIDGSPLREPLSQSSGGKKANLDDEIPF